MNKRAEVNIQGMLISILVVGLFFGFFGATIIVMSNYYDTTGFDADEINSFNFNQNLSDTLQEVQDDVDSVTVDDSWFDFFSGIWSRFLAPFKFIYRSFAYIITMGNQTSDLLQLMPVFKQFFTSVIIVLVVVGIVLIKFGLGRKK